MLDINDLQPGDVVTTSYTKYDYTVVSVDAANGTMTITDPITKKDVTDKVATASALGFFKKSTAATTGGIMNWLPTTTAKQLQAALNKVPAVIPYGGSVQPILPPAGTWKIDLPPEQPKKPGRKQVSHNGKDWCDYRLLLDADPFESYEYRREI